MNVWLQLLIGGVGGLLCVAVGAILGSNLASRDYQAQIVELEEDIDDLVAAIDEIHTGEKAAKFRIRTEGGNSSPKKTTVRKARLRAIIYPTPTPKK